MQYDDASCIWSAHNQRASAMHFKTDHNEQFENTEFIDRTRKLFSQIHLTLISIVQGVAVAVLAQQIYGVIQSSQISLPVCIRIYVCFTYIALILYEYIIVYVAIWERRPYFLDILSFMVVGVSEIMPIYFLTNSEIYWVLMCVLSLAGIMAYCNTRLYVKPEFFVKNRKAFDVVSRYNRNDIFLTIGYFFLCATSWWIAVKWGNVWIDTGLLALLAASLWSMAVKDHHFMSDMYSAVQSISPERKSVVVVERGTSPVEDAPDRSSF